MSKIQIEELEAVTTNSNLKVTPNGTGVLKVSGDVDGTLQLDDVKVKAPPASAAQDYSLILPETNIAADTYLKVDSITGSGSTAEGKLTYATLATPPASPLDGANFTSGTVPSARYSIAASNGAGFKLISYTNITSAVNSVSFTGLDENASYRLTTKDMYVSNNTIGFQPLDSSNNPWGSSRYMQTIGWYGYNKNRYASSYLTQQSTYWGSNTDHYSFVLDFCTGKNSSATYEQLAYFHLYGHGYDYNSNYQYFTSFMEQYSQTRAFGLKVFCNAGGNLQVGSQMILYKLQET